MNIPTTSSEGDVSVTVPLDDGVVKAEGDTDVVKNSKDGGEAIPDGLEPKQGESMADAIRRVGYKAIEDRDKPSDPTSKEGDESTEQTKNEENVQETKAENADVQKEGKEQGKEENKEGDKQAPLSKHKPPTSWKKDTHKIFEGLPEEAQKVILERESEREGFLTNKSKELSNLQKDFGKRIAPYQELEKEFYHDAKLAGMSVVDLIKDSLNSIRVYRDDPARFLKFLADKRGVDLVALANGDMEAAFDSAHNKVQHANAIQKSELDVANDRIKQLEQQLEQKNNDVTTERYNNYIDQWLTTKDTSVINELSVDDKEAFVATFEALHGSIAAQNPNAAPDSILDAAWDRAIWATPSVRKKVSAKQSQKNVQQTIKHTQKVNGAVPITANGNSVTAKKADADLHTKDWHSIFAHAAQLKNR